MQISQESTCVAVFFDKVAGTRNVTLLKRDQHRLFSVKFTKFLRAPCFREHLQWLLLKVSGFQPAIFFKKRLRKRCFFVNFAKFLRTSFLLTEQLRMAASCVYLWILRRFSKDFFYRAPRGNCYFKYKLQNFNHQYSKNFTGAFQAFYRNREVAIRSRSFT